MTRKIFVHHYGVVVGVLLLFGGDTVAGLITPTYTFQFLRADTYTASDGVVDNGTTLQNGLFSPQSPYGYFSSVRERSASVSTSNGMADAHVLTTYESTYFVDDTSLSFDLFSEVRTTRAISGDGSISTGANGERTFGYTNSTLEFDIDGAFAFEVVASHTLNVGNASPLLQWWDSNGDYQGIISDVSGVLQTGSYKFRQLNSVEEYDFGADGTRTNTVNVLFTLDELAEVPEPPLATLMGLAFAGMLGVRRRRLLLSR